jgi:3-hydroxyisobutyrate dehydrogenase
MARIAFVGLGNMGGPMAANLARAGHAVRGFDRSQAALDAAADEGVTPAATLAEALHGAQAVVTMLPAGPQVREAYLEEGGILDSAPERCLLVDCSTVAVETARTVEAAAAERGYNLLDAPVSGGVAGARAGELTFMVGGDAGAVECGRYLFDIMGKAAVYAGPAGNGQVAKACNNMILGISMLAISEAFTLAERQGLDPQTLFDIASQASGSCWAMLNHNPVPGLVETAASNRDYTPGFSAGMMWKDLKLAQDAAMRAGVSTPMGSSAQALYAALCASGWQDKDYSAIYRFLRGETPES